MRLKHFVIALAALFAGGVAHAQEEAPTTAPPVAQTPAPPPPLVPEAPAADAPAADAAPAPTPPAAEPLATIALPPADPANMLALDLSTGGRVLIQLRPDVAPGHVERIKTLARQGFYNGIVFHRVIEGFMAQAGDPRGTGEGGSSLPDINAEFSRLPHMRGTVSMARTNEPNSANSQFFIMFAPRLTLDGNYTVFGRVVEGMQFVDAIPRGEPPANPARIIRASLQSDNVPPPTAAEIAAANRPAAPPASAASAIDAALAAEGGAPPPALASPPPAAPSEAPAPSPSGSAVEALEAAEEVGNAAQNDTGTAADPTAQPVPPPAAEPAVESEETTPDPPQ